MWRPDRQKIARPAFLSLADQVAKAIDAGELQPGERLPTQRQLAYELGLSLQTVSRAYEEMARRGLVSGETGRGTFVRSQRTESDTPFLPERVQDVVDLSILKPVGDALHLDRMKAGLAALAADLPPSVALSFRPNAIFRHHRDVAVTWLRACGLAVAPSAVCLTNGATAGMTMALLTVAASGSTVATEAVGHHTLVPLTSYLGIKLRGVEIDAEGMLPDALARACREGDIKAIFVQPSIINPMASMMSAARREAIADVARAHDIFIIENDPLGPLVTDRPPPLFAFAPERTLYVTTFTKTIMPGLRIGYLAAPERLSAAIANRHLVTNWIATPIMAELATRWVVNGTAQELLEWQRAAVRSRQLIAAEMLAGRTFHAHPQALHVWLPLNADSAEAEFVAHARLLGVAVAPGRSFQTIPGISAPAVRIAVGSTSESELRHGLGAITTLLAGKPDPLLHAI